MGQSFAGIQTSRGRRRSATETCSLRLGPREPCANALLNPRAFKLRDRAKHSSHQTPRRCARVDSFSQGHERHVARLPLVEQQHEVPQVSPEPIESPADDRVHLVPSHISRELVERRPPILGPTHAVVDELHGRPTAGLDITSKLEKLVVTSLIDGRDAGIKGDTATRKSRTMAVFLGLPVS